METMTGAGPDARLAIVIPAWRARHFEAALTSLARQTDRRFNVYVGDDCSPDDLHAIVQSAGAGLNVTFHRFPANLGQRDLVAHWHRCIALTRNEPWLWLFSDDDIADPRCVAAFHRLIDTGIPGTTLLRFNTLIIDESGRITGRPPPHPPKEDACALLNAMLQVGHDRQWFAADHIFQRAAFNRTGGFVNFPKALWSDYATWVRIAAEGDVRTIPGATVRFRRHPQGTSSSGMIASYPDEMVRASVEFTQFAIAIAGRLAPMQSGRYHRLARRSLFNAIYRCSNRPAHFIRPDLIDRCWRAVGGSRWRIRLIFLGYAVRAQLRLLPPVKQISHWRYRQGLAR